MNMQELVDMGKEYVMNTYNRFPYVFEKGEGAYLYDSNGKKYLDMVAGIAVNALGYGNERLVKALEKQMHEVMHTSNLYWIPNQVKLAKMLVERSCFDKVFFCNSGAEAIESALKLARKYGNMEGKGGRYEIITMENSFHGRTYGAITATGQFKYQKNLGELLPGIKYAKYNDFDSVLAAVTDKTVAILLEPVQGEGGLIPADPQFMKQIRALCDEKDMLMMVDEVQTGVGRTGKLFGYQHYGIEPDVMSLAKGLGGGMPIGAMLANDKAAAAFQPGDHASTFGGNHMSTAAGIAVLEAFEEDGILENAAVVGEYLQSKNAELAVKYPQYIETVRGLGLMQGIVLKDAANILPIREAAGEMGMLIISAGYNVLRMVPPLILTKEQVDEAFAILDKAFAML